MHRGEGVELGVKVAIVGAGLQPAAAACERVHQHLSGAGTSEPLVKQEEEVSTAEHQDVVAPGVRHDIRRYWERTLLRIVAIGIAKYVDDQKTGDVFRFEVMLISVIVNLVDVLAFDVAADPLCLGEGEVTARSDQPKVLSTGVLPVFG